MGTVDYALPQSIDGPAYFYPHLARRKATRPFPTDTDFACISTRRQSILEACPIVGDAIIHLPPGMELPDFDFELVGKCLRNSEVSFV